MQKIGNLIRAITTAACLMVVISCSPTNIDAVWKDPAFRGGKLNNVLVIGGSTEQIIRRLFEDEFAARFKSRGTNAVQSYTIFPSEKDLNKDSIEAKSRELGFDAILIMRLVDTKTEKNYNPPPNSFYYRNTYFYDWPNRYSRFGPGSNLSAYYYDDRMLQSEYEVANVETTVYDSQTGNIIWSAQSKTVLGGSRDLEISSLIDVVMKSLSDNQLL